MEVWSNRQCCGVQPSQARCKEGSGCTPHEKSVMTWLWKVWLASKWKNRGTFVCRTRMPDMSSDKEAHFLAL